MEMMSASRRFAQALFLLVALVCHDQPATAEDMPTEQSVRAAMVFNFLKFTEFPPGKIAGSQPMQVCIDVSDLQQAEALLSLAGRKIRGRELVVVKLTGRVGDCQVLYVDSRKRWNAAKEQHGFLNTLTISAYPGFAQNGGIIEIALQEEGVRFDINLVEARRTGFRFFPQLLRLARHLYE